MNVIKMKMADLRTAEKNVRNHPQKQLDELRRSYEMFGQYRPLVVSSDGEILVGNGLFTALSQIGVEEVDVIKLPESTPLNYKRKLMMSDNKVYMLGTDNITNIDYLFKEMQDFDLPGFDETTLKEIYSMQEEFSENIDDIAGMGKVPVERVEQIKTVETQRVENPPTNKVMESKPQSKYEAPEPSESSGNYINCPHCGAKIWL